MRQFATALICALLAATAAAQPSPKPEVLSPDDYRRDALAILPIVQGNYAYLDRFADERVTTSETLRAEADAVHDLRSLVRYANRVLLPLTDLHALATRNLADSWSAPPTGADLWVEWRGGVAVVTAVRPSFPADMARITVGDRLLAVDGVPTADAVRAFWADLGLPVTDQRSDFALLQLAAGRHDRPRRFTFAEAGEVALPIVPQSADQQPPLSVSAGGDTLVVKFQNSLGDPATIEAFDALMAETAPERSIRLDLTSTPSGGNTTVACAIMGWFVDQPSAYQIYELPREERETGVARRWVEQVLPRGRRHTGPVEVRVGRWTGSMGEGLAIGFDAMGARVCGDRMAGLRGAVYDFRLERSGLVFKLPVERLSAVDGTPREEFVPAPCLIETVTND